MTTRDTSVEAYNKIKSNGLLGKMQFEVYHAVYNFGPCTSAEAYVHMNKSALTPITQSRARFTELRNKGVLKELGMRDCTVTGQHVIVWEVTKELPKKLPRKLKTKEEFKNGYKKALDDVVCEVKRRMLLPMADQDHCQYAHRVAVERIANHLIEGEE